MKKTAVIHGAKLKQLEQELDDALLSLARYPDEKEYWLNQCKKIDIAIRKEKENQVAEKEIYKHYGMTIERKGYLDG